jgi:phage-related protein
LLGLSAAADAAAGAEDAGGGGLGGMVYMWGALVVAIAAVLPGFLAAGAAIGSFAAFAVPTVERVWKAIQAGPAAVNKLPGPLRMVGQEFENLTKEYDKFAKAFQMLVARLMSQGLGILSDLLPKLVPLANAGAKALGALMDMLGRGLQSQGFQNFLNTLIKLAVPATVAIGHLAGAILGLVGHITTALPSISVPFINFLTSLVKVLTGPVVAALRLGAELMMGLFRAITPILPLLGRFATVLLNDVGSSFMALVPLLTQLVKDLLPAFTAAISVIEPILANMLTPNSPLLTAISMLLKFLPVLVGGFTQLMAFLKANPWFTRIAVDVLSAAAAFKILGAVISVTGGILDALLSPEIAVAIAIAALVIGMMELYRHFKLVRDIVADVGHFFRDAFGAALHAVAAVIKWFDTSVLPGIKSAIADLAAWWKAHSQEIKTITKEVWKLVSTFVSVYMTLVVAEVKIGLAILKAVWGVAWAVITSVLKTAWQLVKIIVDSTFHEVLDIVGIILDLLTGHWSRAWNEMKALVSTVLHEIVDLIKTILSGLVSILYNAGRAAVMGLVHGLESAASAVGSAAGSIAHKIGGFFGLSPALEGPLSGSGAPEVRGRHFAQDLAKGVLAGRSSIVAAMASLSGVLGYTAGAHPGALAGANAGSGMHITVPITLAPGMGALTSPQFLNGLMPVVQEAILRYAQLNQSSGIAGFNRRS